MADLLSKDRGRSAPPTPASSAIKVINAILNGEYADSILIGSGANFPPGCWGVRRGLDFRRKRIAEDEVLREPGEDSRRGSPRTSAQ